MRETADRPSFTGLMVHREPALGYSFLIPEGWQRGEVRGAEGTAVLERAMLTRKDELTVEAAKLLSARCGTVAVASRALEATPFKNSRTRVNYGPVTISLGMCMASEATDPGELYSKTDIALYCAKNAGRNCSYAYQDGMQKDFTKSWLIYKN